jgi:hypothetical protein
MPLDGPIAERTGVDTKESKPRAREERARPKVPRQWFLPALFPVLVGVLWMWFATHAGPFGLLLEALPGMLLLATGLSNLLWAGDSRLFHFMAVGSLAGIVLAVPAVFIVGWIPASILLLASAGCFVVTGYLSIRQEPVPEGVPAPEVSPGLALRVAGDETSMAGIVLSTWPHSVGARAARISGELDDALELFSERGWLERPRDYHATPPPLQEPERHGRRQGKREFEHVVFESLYEPHPGEPGCERWLGYEANRTAHAWVWKHPGGPRPWLVCVHGIRMGSPRADFGLFPEYLYEELGMNLAFPVLPIHGPRRIGPISGDRILSGDVMDTLHAGAQAVWDFRRLLTWLRHDEGAPFIGVVGHSLGGYASALLAAVDDGIDCVVVGNPAVDPSHLFWRNALSVATRDLRSHGVTEARMCKVLRPVSPLAMTARVPFEGRAIFAGIADRVVPPVEAATLWRHWDEPRIAWYGGTHRGFLRTPEGRETLLATLRQRGITM